MDWFRCNLRTDDEEITLIVDALLDKNIVVSGLRYYGEIRLPSQNSTYPVIFIEENNVVDSGSNVEEIDRYERLRLHGKSLQIGDELSYAWPDGTTFQLIVKSRFQHADPTQVRRSGRPPKDDEWVKLWFALLEMAKDGRLNRNFFQTQDSLITELITGQNVGLSYDSIKPRVSQIWHRLRLGQS